MIAPHHSGLERQIDSMPIDLRKLVILRLKLERRLDIRYDHHDTGDFLKGVQWADGFTPQLLDVVMNDTIAEMRRADGSKGLEKGNGVDESRSQHYPSAPYFRDEQGRRYASLKWRLW